jgi:hypothetical protein
MNNFSGTKSLEALKIRSKLQKNAKNTNPIWLASSFYALYDRIMKFVV